MDVGLMARTLKALGEFDGKSNLDLPEGHRTDGKMPHSRLRFANCLCWGGFSNLCPFQFSDLQLDVTPHRQNTLEFEIV